jgi:hypothetical protein
VCYFRGPGIKYVLSLQAHVATAPLLDYFSLTTEFLKLHTNATLLSTNYHNKVSN